MTKLTSEVIRASLRQLSTNQVREVRECGTHVRDSIVSFVDNRHSVLNSYKLFNCNISVGVIENLLSVPDYFTLGDRFFLCAGFM
jgi:hypothetical protein